jgi:hypothetical protein
MLWFTLGACGGGPNGEQAAAGTGSDSTQMSTAATVDDKLEGYHRYEGTIGDLPIVAHIQIGIDGAEGSYYYLKNGQSIPLYGYADSVADGVFVFEEGGESPEEGQSCRWSISGSGQTMAGTWSSSKGKQFPIKLTALYPEGSIRLGLFSEHDTVSYNDKQGAPVVSVALSMLQLAETSNGPIQKIINDSLLKACGCGLGQDGPQCFEQQKNEYVAEWKGSMKEEEQAGELGSGRNNYSFGTRQQVLRNEGGWLVVETMSSSYTGGAHGSYGASYLNIDTRIGRGWQLGDVIATVDTAKIKPLLRASVRKRYHLADKAPISDILFDNDVSPTLNIALMPEGILFAYNPYEIGPYAAGIIELYVTYEALKPYLTTGFKERMGMR